MRILVTGAWQGFRENEEKLKAQGHDLAFLQWEKDPLPCDYEWPEAIIGNGIFLSHPIEKFTNLRYIQLTSAGYDRVPMDYVTSHGIEIHNAKGVYSIPMAEYAVGAALQLYKQFPAFAQSQKQHQWNKIRTLRELNQSKVLVLGCGSVGTECAKRFKAFDCQVIGIDLYPREDSNYDAMYPLTTEKDKASSANQDRAESSEKDCNTLDTMLSLADIVILTLPLTDQTKGLINKERIQSLKDDAMIINISRGGVMDYQAFIDLKQTTKQELMGAFDVFHEEPLDQESLLWNMDGVIVTPHNSFVGAYNQERLSRVIMMNLQ